MNATHGACGKSWKQSGERTSHCGGCHETFVSLKLFDAHRRGRKCLNPAKMIFQKEPLAQREDGVWFSPAVIKAAHAVFDKEEKDGERHSRPD